MGSASCGDGDRGPRRHGEDDEGPHHHAAPARSPSASSAALVRMRRHTRELGEASGRRRRTIAASSRKAAGVALGGRVRVQIRLRPLLGVPAPEPHPGRARARRWRAGLASRTRPSAVPRRRARPPAARRGRRRRAPRPIQASSVVGSSSERLHVPAHGEDLRGAPPSWARAPAARARRRTATPAAGSCDQREDEREDRDVAGGGRAQSSLPSEKRRGGRPASSAASERRDGGASARRCPGVTRPIDAQSCRRLRTIDTRARHRAPTCCGGRDVRLRGAPARAGRLRSADGAGTGPLRRQGRREDARSVLRPSLLRLLRRHLLPRPARRGARRLLPVVRACRARGLLLDAGHRPGAPAIPAGLPVRPGAFVGAIAARVDTVWFTVHESNDDARALHATLGAREVATHDRYFGPGEPRIVSRIDRMAFERLRTPDPGVWASCPPPSPEP